VEERRGGRGARKKRSKKRKTNKREERSRRLVQMTFEWNKRVESSNIV